MGLFDFFKKKKIDETVNQSSKEEKTAKQTTRFDEKKDSNDEAIVSSMSVKEMIVYLSGLKSKKDFDRNWISLLGKLGENGYDKFEMADVVNAFADDRIGSQNKSDIVFAMAMSSNAESMLSIIIVAGQQYCIRTFGSA